MDLTSVCARVLGRTPENADPSQSNVCLSRAVETQECSATDSESTGKREDAWWAWWAWWGTPGHPRTAHCGQSQSHRAPTRKIVAPRSTHERISAAAPETNLRTICGVTERLRSPPVQRSRPTTCAIVHSSRIVLKGRRGQNRAGKVGSEHTFTRDIGMAPSAASSSSPALASLSLFKRALFDKYSGARNLVVEHPVKQTLLYHMSPHIPRTPATTVCSLKGEGRRRSIKQSGVKRINTRTRFRGGSSSIDLGEAKGRGTMSLLDLMRRMLPEPPRPVESSREDWKPQRLLRERVNSSDAP